MLNAPVLRLRPCPTVFRRWSRKKYAQFLSIHREVVIGVIKASICYASMLKMGILMNDAHSPEVVRRAASGEDDDGPGGPPLAVALAILSTLAPVVRKASTTAGCRQVVVCPNSDCDTFL